jgi:glycosyltransferase involved in cell wall biosynthesis
MFRTAAAIIAVSRDMERQLAALGAPPEKIHWNPCGVDTEAFSRADPGSAPPHFLSVGRFVDKKSPHLTMLAFRTVLEEIPESRLTMAGGGSLRESSMEICEALGMGGRVDFPGILSREEVAAAMSRSRCFVQHSRVTKFGDSEGTPVAVLEAGASCLPAVVTCHAGFAEAVVEGKTGFLVKEGDYRSMGRRMLELARDPALARTMGVAARERIRRIYDFDRRIPRLWEILLKAIEARPGQSQ